MVNWKTFLRLLLLLLLAAGGGYFILVTPDNPLTRAFQRKVASYDARVIVGPYPTAADFLLLKANHVGLVVSLLDPAIPYEAQLLNQERAAAAAHGLRLANFPMSSILGRKFGNYYDDNACAAATLVHNSPDKIYLHCYLGLHRVRSVREHLEQMGDDAATYAIRESERKPSQRVLDAAEASFNAKRYEESLARLAEIPPRDWTIDAGLLRAWTLYRLNRVADADIDFATVLAARPNSIDARLGAGYAALRSERPAIAETHFAIAANLAPQNPDALGGLGLAQHRNGHRAEAIKNLQTALLLAPDNQEFRDALSRIR